MPSKRDEYDRKRYQAQRQALFDMYGHECACCGEKTREFLTLDHVYGDGPAHRAKAGPRRTYQDALEQYDPKKYRILCANCNQATSHKRRCPHEASSPGLRERVSELGE